MTHQLWIMYSAKTVPLCEKNAHQGTVSISLHNPTFENQYLYAEFIILNS